MNKAVFLDRDGVINHDPGDYTKNLSEFEILPNVIETLKEMHDDGFLLIGITNQGGIAKGLYTEKEVDEIHTFLNQECLKLGFQFTEIYYCPHHPDFSNCLCRKPKSLLVEKAITRFNIDPKHSVFFGDKTRDVECANGAGVEGVKTETNSSLADAWKNWKTSKA